MPDTLSALFQKSCGAPISIDGRPTYPIFERRLRQGHQKLLVRRLGATNLPCQGLRIKAVRGLLEVGGRSYPEIILWADTSPDFVEIAIAGDLDCLIKIWNVWRISELTQAWIGNAGMQICESEAHVILGCSDGVGEINFSDLIVEIEFVT